MPKAIRTIGHSVCYLEAFLGLLAGSSIRLLAAPLFPGDEPAGAVNFEEIGRSGMGASSASDSE